MKSIKLCNLWIVIICGFVTLSLHAQTRTQTVPLAKGWNAVWLEVQPAEASPEDVFRDMPVDIVAGYTRPVSEAQFAKNKSVNLQSLAGWNVWYAPYRADAPLTRLQRMNADTAYLVHTTEAATLSITGTVTGAAMKWTPGRFNLVGFTVAAQGGPTFRQLFEGSAAHNHNKIYRLANGVWRQVLQTDAEAPRPGEAFWIWCEGGSDYQGPLWVKPNTSIGLVLGGSTPAAVEFGNASKHPLSFTMSPVVDENNAAIPLAAMIKVLAPDAAGFQGIVDVPVDFPDGEWTQDFPEYEAGDGVSLSFVLRVKDMPPGKRAGLLKVSSDIGTETWIPVYGEN